MNTKIGIFFTEGDQWHEQRRFTLRYLRDFGFGRRFETLEKESECQISQSFEIIRSGPKFDFEEKFFKNGQVLLPYAFGPAFGNCFLSVLFNAPLSREDMAPVYKLV